MPEPPSVEAAFKAGLEYLPYDAPAVPIFVRQTVEGTVDGPCELLFRQLEMLPIDDLDRKSVYLIGVAMRLAGFLLDMGGRDPDTAMRLHGELAVAAGEHMERFAAGTHGPYSYDVLVTDFIRIANLDVEEDAIRRLFEKYVAQAKLQPEAAAEEKADRRAPPAFIHPEIERACEELLGNVKVFIIDSTVYDACEVSSWYGGGRISLCDVFKFEVDGETWPAAISDPTIQMQTEFLLVDGRTDIWRLYEKLAYRGVYIPDGCTEVVGVVLNSLTGDYESIKSNAVYVPRDGIHYPWELDRIQQGRIVRVFATFLLLLQNKRVRIGPDPKMPKHRGRWKVELPLGSSVDDLVAEVLGTAAARE